MRVTALILAGTITAVTPIATAGSAAPQKRAATNWSRTVVATPEGGPAEDQEDDQSDQRAEQDHQQPGHAGGRLAVARDDAEGDDLQRPAGEHDRSTYQGNGDGHPVGVHAATVTDPTGFCLTRFG